MINGSLNHQFEKRKCANARCGELLPMQLSDPHQYQESKRGVVDLGEYFGKKGFLLVVICCSFPIKKDTISEQVSLSVNVLNIMCVTVFNFCPCR
ncbi:hypothetical protein LINPERPRIM_LOCUS8689, partial [Linum perenne]